MQSMNETTISCSNLVLVILATTLILQKDSFVKSIMISLILWQVIFFLEIDFLNEKQTEQLSLVALFVSCICDNKPLTCLFSLSALWFHYMPTIQSIQSDIVDLDTLQPRTQLLIRMHDHMYHNNKQCFQ